MIESVGCVQLSSVTGIRTAEYLATTIRCYLKRETIFGKNMRKFDPK